MRKCVLIPLLAILTGCASAMQQKTVEIGNVAETVKIEVVGSYNQENDPFAWVSAQSNISKIPIDALINSAGVNSVIRLKIGTAKSVDFRIIGSGIQNSKSWEVRDGDTHAIGGLLESQLSEE